MNILALDCGEYTGFATLINGSIRSGVEHWKHKTNESAGMKYLRFDAWLREMNQVFSYHIDLIAYEKPHGLQGNAVESMNGYITGIHRFCAGVSGLVQYQAVSPATIKKWATGNGRASKPEMIRQFLLWTGHDPIDENEADAYSLLRFIMNEIGVTL